MLNIKVTSYQKFYPYMAAGRLFLAENYRVQLYK
jgi:hypothetical protein